MKIFLIFVIFMLCFGLCACSKDDIKSETEIMKSTHFNFEQKEQSMDLSIYINNGGGFINIDDDEFIRKSKSVNKNTTYNELVDIFGEEPGDIKERAYDDYFYMNDNYLLRYHYGYGVVLFEFSNPQNYLVID